MRILFVSSQYPPYEMGGYEQLCQEVANCLQARGHDVMILTSRHGIKSNDEMHAGNVKRSLYLLADIDYYRPLDFFVKSSLHERENIRQLRETIDSLQPDVVMFWGMFALSLNLPYWAEVWLPGRVTYYLASYWPVDTDLHRQYWMLPTRHPVAEWLKRPLRALALSKLKREGYPPRLQFQNIICCSEYVRRRLLQEGVIPDKAEVVYPGLDPEPYRSFPDINPSSGNVLRLLYFGRLIADKGVHTAIDAMSMLCRDGFGGRLHLTIVGEGHPEYLKLLRRKIRDLQLESNVSFGGRLPHSKVPEMLREYDVFLFTSIWPEPFGRTIIEAMMAGLPVIGSEVGGSQELFQMYCMDLLYQPDDAIGLAEKITALLKDPGLRRRLSAQGRRLALERFTMDTMVNGIEAHLERLAARNRGPQTI
jgi:glycosyltransferase involved in cell wall biosynthesis